MSGSVPTPITRDTRPVVANVVHSFAVGGLENGVVNLINSMPCEKYRHVIIALTEASPQFSARIRQPGVAIYELRKPAGYGIKVYPQLTKLFRALKPTIVHTRNLAALEATVPAWWTGVPVRIHGEHGWDVGDLHGGNSKYRLVRRCYKSFVTHYIALSDHLQDYLVSQVGVERSRVTRICNGVDTERFHPATPERKSLAESPFNDPSLFVLGTVGRMHEVKDQRTLARAFLRMLEIAPSAANRARLAVVGDGPLRAEVLQMFERAGRSDLAWLPGERADVADVMRGMDCFVLPSLAEGISNTILEAMATALPVIATRVGGNPELVQDGITGVLVPAADIDAMAQKMLRYCDDREFARRHGSAGRKSVVAQFSLDAMVASYVDLYDRLSGRVQAEDKQRSKLRAA